MTTSHVFWAKSESQASAMQALGWRVGQDSIFHHNQYALLLVWRGDGEPPMPKREKCET